MTITLDAPAAAGDWLIRAACRGHDPEMFFPAHESDLQAAMSVCARCPVRGECGAWAVATGAVGVWGGQLHGPRPSPYVDALSHLRRLAVMGRAIAAGGTLRGLAAEAGLSDESMRRTRVWAAERGYWAMGRGPGSSRLTTAGVQALRTAGLWP